MKTVLCHHDWHFILCFLILVFIFIGSILMYTECDLRTTNSFTDKYFKENQVGLVQPDVAKQDDNEIEETTNQKNIVTTSAVTSQSISSSRFLTFQETPSSQPSISIRTSTKTPIPIISTTNDPYSQSQSSFLPEIFTTTRGWIFPKQLQKEELKSSANKIHNEEENLECVFVLIFIVMSAAGLLLLLLLWCMVILWC